MVIKVCVSVQEKGGEVTEKEKRVSCGSQEEFSTIKMLGVFPFFLFFFYPPRVALDGTTT